MLLFFLFLIHHQVLASRSDENQLDCKTIDAGLTFKHRRLWKHYLISGDELVSYNEEWTSEMKVSLLEDLGVLLGHVDATLTFNKRYRRGQFRETPVVVFSECRFYKYSVTRDGDLSLRRSGNMSDLGLPCDVDAAFSVNGKLYVVKGCDVWKYRNNRGSFHQRGSTDNWNLPCDIDAVLQIDQPIAIKGTQYWQFWGASVIGPFHTDDLNICSWYLCGEADWIFQERVSTSELKCNGDSRFCELRLDQATWPGLHNAGSGEDTNGLLSCWLQNHGMNITQQLEAGIRHLDIDPCYSACGNVVGICHSSYCSGSTCSVLKQVRKFMKTNQDAVVTVNFNHEVQDAEEVFVGLTRQIQTQLRPLLNSQYRRSDNEEWPTLGEIVLSNRRLFVFYAVVSANSGYLHLFDQHSWIHPHYLIARTWQEFSVSQDCSPLVGIINQKCARYSDKSLIQLSIVPTLSMSQPFQCIDDTARLCRPFLQDTLRACQTYRFMNDKSPNILLVDYPEEGLPEAASVYQASFQQNLRNLLYHRPECSVRIDAVIRVGDKAFIFSDSKLLEYSFVVQKQTNATRLPQELHPVDAVQSDEQTDKLRIFKNEQIWRFDPLTYQFDIERGEASVINEDQGQNELPHLTSPTGEDLVFCGENICRRMAASGDLIPLYPVMDWNVDVVSCD